jgi:hypothetical protein
VANQGFSCRLLSHTALLLQDQQQFCRDDWWLHVQLPLLCRLFSSIIALFMGYIAYFVHCLLCPSDELCMVMVKWCLLLFWDVAL